MESGRTELDKTCALLRRLAEAVGRGPLPSIPFAGEAYGRCMNPPAAHVELLYMVGGGYDPLVVGHLRRPVPAGTLSIHTVHFGNHAQPLPGTRCWCMFLDVSDLSAFADVAAVPHLATIGVTRARRMGAAFELLSTRCRLGSTRRANYLLGPWTLDVRQRRRMGEAALLLIRAAVLELLAVALDEATGSAADDESEPVRAAAEFIARHYNNPLLTLAMIAEAAGVSPDHLGRGFRRAIGSTPMQHLRDLRLQHAAYLLRHTRLRVGEIAQQAGFADAFYFSRTFRQAHQQSPRAWRAGHA